MAKKKKTIKVDGVEKEKLRQRILNFKATYPNTFGDASDDKGSNGKTVTCLFGVLTNK